MKKGRDVFKSCLAMLLQGVTRQTATKGTTASVMKHKKYWCMMSLLLSFVASFRLCICRLPRRSDQSQFAIEYRGNDNIESSGGAERYLFMRCGWNAQWSFPDRVSHDVCDIGCGQNGRQEGLYSLLQL